MSKKVERSGVIPYIIEDGQIKLMFMKPSEAKYGGNVYQIAKGKQEKGETALEAGLREASEELGLFVGNISESYDLGTFMGRTSIHVVKIKDKELFGDPCNETESVRWLTPEEFYEEGRDLHKPVIKAAERLIKEKEGYGELYNILEVYGSRRDLNWTTSIPKQGGTQTDATFSIDNEDYNITLSYHNLPLPTRALEVVQVSFQRIINGEPEVKLTNSKHPASVIGIIYNAVIEKLFTERPDIIVLSAKNINDESNLKIRQKRISLYQTIAQQAMMHGVYTVLQEPVKSTNATNIVLLRNDKNAVKLTPEELQYVKDNI